jgi:hypothetical protein
LLTPVAGARGGAYDGFGRVAAHEGVAGLLGVVARFRLAHVGDEPHGGQGGAGAPEQRLGGFGEGEQVAREHVGALRGAAPKERESEGTHTHKM